MGNISDISHIFSTSCNKASHPEKSLYKHKIAKSVCKIKNAWNPNANMEVLENENAERKVSLL